MPTMPGSHKPRKSGAIKHRTQLQEKQRGSSTKRGYGRRWQKARRYYFNRHPLCVHCEAAGKITVATDLDHITPHKGNMQVFWDSSNWQGLCKPCHSKKTAGEDGGFGNIKK